MNKTDAATLLNTFKVNNSWKWKLDVNKIHLCSNTFVLWFFKKASVQSLIPRSLGVLPHSQVTLGFCLIPRSLWGSASFPGHSQVLICSCGVSQQLRQIWEWSGNEASYHHLATGRWHNFQSLFFVYQPFLLWYSPVVLLCVFADNGEDNFSIQGRTHSLPGPGTTEGSLDGIPMSCRWREFDKGHFIILQSCEIRS